VSFVHDLGAAGLRALDPELAHSLAVRALKAGLGPKPTGPDDPILAVELAGLRLPNCVGLAAGFDKHAEAPDALLSAGFGFVECGTVTPQPQPGNPRPRVFRLNQDRAVINRYGFNSLGLEAFATGLQRRRSRGVVGANIGANKESSDRIADYLTGLERLWPLADYFTANISSPNTPGLRALQGREALDDLLGRLSEIRRRLATAGEDRPLFLKVAPDLSDAEIDDVCESAEAHALDGLIVGNTTLSRPEGLKSPHASEAGGLSGAPLMALSTRVLARFRSQLAGRLALIGCGGIDSGADAYAKIRAGACAVQIYTAMSFRGLGLIRQIKRDLAARLRADGFASVVEAIGAG
jgi:dihydroorotate dehydrogenase